MDFHHEEEEKKHATGRGVVTFHGTLNIAQLPSIRQYLEQSQTQFEIKQNEYALVSRGGTTLTVYPRRIVPADEDEHEENGYGPRRKDYAIVTGANGEECCRFTNDKIPKQYCFLYSKLWQLVHKARKKIVMYRLIRTDRGMQRITCLVSLAQTLSVEYSAGAVVFLADVHNSKFLFKSNKEQSMRDVPWRFNVQEPLHPFEFSDKYDKMVRTPLHEFAHVMRALLKQGHQTEEAITGPFTFEWNADQGFPFERLRAPAPVEASPVATSLTDASSQELPDNSHICQQLREQMASMANDIKLIRQTQQQQEQQQQQQERHLEQQMDWEEKKQEIAAMISNTVKSCLSPIVHQMKQQQNSVNELAALKKEFSSAMQANVTSISQSVVSELQPVMQAQMDDVLQKMKSADVTMCNSIVDACREDSDNRMRAHQKTLKKHLQQIAKNLNQLHEADERLSANYSLFQQQIKQQQRQLTSNVQPHAQHQQRMENLQQWMEQKLSEQHRELTQMLLAPPPPPHPPYDYEALKSELHEIKHCLSNEVSKGLAQVGKAVQDVRCDMERLLMQRPKENENEHEAKTSEDAIINVSHAEKLPKQRARIPPRRLRFQPVQMHPPAYLYPSPKQEHEIIDIGDPQIPLVQKSGTLYVALFVMLVMLTGLSMRNFFM